MKHLYLPFLAAAIWAHSAIAQDNCGSPLPVTAGITYTVDLVNGVPSAFVCSPSFDLATRAEWYTYTATQDTMVIVSTDLPQNAGGDTRIQVFEGACGSLLCVDGDDDSGAGLLAIASFEVEAGLTYYIVFDDYWSSNGFDFVISETTPPQNAVDFTQVTMSGPWFDCVVDMNGDHLDDVVQTDATTIRVNYQLPEGGFNYVVIPTPPADHTASWSICAGDLDHNGMTDLMYGGGGVTFMLANEDGTAFTEYSFSQFIFCQRTNMVDLNNDGHLDAFTCHDIDANVYFINDGSNNFSFNQGGMGETCGNYGSVFIDMDNDHDMDLFVAKCGCDAVDILYRNLGNFSFQNEASPLGFADGQQSWSSAWGDYDNDGDMDVLVGSSGNDPHKVMRNDGAVFTDVSSGSGFDTFDGSSIEWTTHDFNNDGWLDVLGGGKLMLNNGDMSFTQTVITPGNGPVGDLNNDGFLDIVNTNKAFMNQGNANHHIAVHTIGTVSNTSAIGARVEVVSPLGTQIRDVKSGDGFAFMSSLNSYFGLGADTVVYSVAVYWPSGIVNVVEAPAIDTILTIVEEATTDVAAMDQDNGLELFPNPTEGALSLVLPQGSLARQAEVLDMEGRRVMELPVLNNRADVSELKSGVYLLRAIVGDRSVQRKFTRR